MPVGDNNTVAITIQVVDANSQQAIQGVETRFVGLGETASAAGAQISSTTQKLVGFNEAIIKTGGAAGAVDPALAAMRAQAQQMSQAMTSITSQAIETAAALNAVAEAAERGGQRFQQSMHGTIGSMREVSGMGRELGLNLGYSMRHAISENEGLMATLSAMEGLFVAIAAVDIFMQLVDGAEKFYEKWFDVSKAVDEYTQKAGVAAQQKLFNTGSLETEISLLKQAQNEVDRLNAKKQAAGADLPAGGFFQYFQGMRPIGMPGMDVATPMHGNAPVPHYTTGNDEQNAQAQLNLAVAQLRNAELQHQYAEDRQKAEEAYTNAALTGRAKIAQGERDAIANAQLQLAYTKEQEQNLQKMTEATLALQKAQGVPEDKQVKVYHADPNAGNAAYDLAMKTATGRASGENVAASRAETEQIIQMQNQAVDAGLKGNALLQAQKEQAIAAVVRKYQQSELSIQAADTETRALEEKFQNDRLKQIDEGYDKARKMQQDASAAGLTGIPKIQAEGTDKSADLYKDMNGDLGAMYHARQAIEQETDQQILEARRQFTEKLQQIENSSQLQMLSGNARITVQEKQQLDGLAADYRRQGDSSVATSQQYAQTRTAIEQNADRERQQYSQQVNEQITQTEAQAARAILPPWQAATAAIEEQYQQRFAKAHQELMQGAIDQQQYDREIVADSALAQAEMARQSEQTRDQIAGHLQSLFTNPAEFMKNRAKQVMSDILANWVQQLMNAHSQIGGALGGLLGMNPVGTGSPRNALSTLFGGHHGQSGTQESALTNAGSTLNNAGTTLSSSGTMLMDAASQIQAAVQEMQAAFGAGGAGVGNPLARGGFGGLGGTGSGWTGIGSMPGVGSPTLWGTGGGGGGGSTAELSGAGGAGMNGAYSLANTISGGAAKVVPGAGSAIQQGIQLSQTLRTAVSGMAGSGSSAPMLNPTGAFQPTDIAPTNTAGVLGTVPNSDPESPASSTSGVAGAFGMGAGLLAGGMGLFGSFESGYNSKTFASGLTSMLGGAMSGASIGTMFAPGIGTVIGAAAGAMVGLLGDIFGDHGRAQAQKYNIDTVIPGLQQAMDGFSTGGNSYDGASQAINSLQMQALQQCKQWGSGAWSVYQQTIIPEVNNAMSQVNREGAAGRSNVTMSAAQFDSGGIVGSFGDFSTGPHSGFIHARVGERVMNPMASMMHGPMLDAMNAGASSLLRMQRNAPVGGGGSAGGGVHHHYHIHAIDTRDFAKFLRTGGINAVQTELNQLAGRYAGRALNI